MWLKSHRENSRECYINYLWMDISGHFTAALLIAGKWRGRIALAGVADLGE